MVPKLLILGAGQYGTVVKEIAEETEKFEEIAFLDDSYGEENSNYHEEAIGKISDLETFAGKYQYAIPAIGNAEFRMKLLQEAESFGFVIPILVSKYAFISQSAVLKKGVVVEPMAVVHANTLVCEGSYISAGAVVNHNAVVASGCYVDNNTVVMSSACVEANTTTKPCEVIYRMPLKFSQNEDGKFKGIAMYDKKQKWVQDYIRENGHEPTFF